MKVKKLPYRKGVGAVLFNAEGKVFVAQRLDNPGKYWQMPQGGIDKGEKPRQALIREVAEEIGNISYEIIAKGSSWISYDLPDELIGVVWKGRYRGQKQKWFALKFTGDDGDINLNATSHPEFSEWKWVDIGNLPSLAIPFKRELYEKIAAEFKRFASSHTSGRL